MKRTILPRGKSIFFFLGLIQSFYGVLQPSECILIKLLILQSIISIQNIEIKKKIIKEIKKCETKM